MHRYNKKIGSDLKPLNADHPWDYKIVPDNSYWGIGLVVALLLLAGQILYFEGATFTRNPVFRPHLEKICQRLDCRLPAYKNPAEFTLLQNSLSYLSDRRQLFRVVVSNRAAFAQPYPNLELTLRDYSGNPFAQRIFLPQNYLPKGRAATSVILPNATVEIRLNIAVPKTIIGGYTFELIY